MIKFQFKVNVWFLYANIVKSVVKATQECPAEDKYKRNKYKTESK